MTDQELLQLLEDKSPQELSLDELRLLKQRLADSPALRDALAGQLGIDGNLAAALGRVDVSPEKLLARASVGPRKRRRSWAVAIMGVALLIAGIVVTVARRTGEDETPGTVARSNGNSPDENGAGDKSGEPADAAKSNDAATSSVTGTPGGNEPDPNVPAVSGAPAPPIAPPVAAVAPAPALPPWHDVLAAAYQPPAFADVCFESFDVTKSLPQRGDLEKWFEPVAGQSLRIADTNSALGKCVVLQGVARLKAPLGGDRALRVWMENYQRIQIHLFSGDRGVTLTFHEDDYFRWSAYATTRVAESPLPNTWALATTDDNRNRRTEIRVGGPMELRHRDGEVILSRGDVVLLRAALDGPPTDVYFAGNALFHGITLVRTKDFPRGVAAEEDANKTRLAERKNVTAELAWKEQLGAGARVEKLADGAVRLVADGAKARGWLSAPLPKVGLHEIVLQLEDVTSGAGISLARDNERPALTLRFVNDKRHNGLALVPCPDDDAREVTLQPIAERFQPLVTRSPWVKLVVGPGIVRWWISVDGVHWAEWQQPLINVPVGLTQLALHHVATAPECRLTLKSVSLRPLDAILGAADEGQVARAPALLDPKDFETWSKTVAEQKPADVPPADWRRACAVRALAGGCGKPVGSALALLLLQESLERDQPVDKQVRLMEQVLQISDLRESAPFVADLAKHFHRLGAAAFDRHRQRPFSAVRHELLALPFHTPHAVPVVEPQLIRTELLLLLYESRWQDAVEFCRQLRFFRLHEQVPLLDWADALARRESPGREAPDPAAELRTITTKPRFIRRRLTRGERDAIIKQKAGWQHPFVEELNKETYNTLAELQGILDSAAYDDAAKMIAALNPELMSGVAPMADDDRLLVSIPAAIRLAISDYPPLQAAMDQRYGAIAQLRVRQSINAGNVAAVELAAVQFAATEAAAEARQWLGDRALAMGWFARAAAEYRRAATTAGPNLRDAVQARARLTAALLGDDAGPPVTRPVQLGEKQLSAAEFEALVADLRQREKTVRGEIVSVTGGNPVGVAPPPVKFTPQVRAAFDGPAGEVPQEDVRNVNKFKVDWVGRQLATVVDGDWLLVSNRFQVAAYDLRSGQRLWQSTPPPGQKMLKARDWTGVAMRPLVTSQYIFVRQLFGEGPLLTCLEKQTGKLLWFTSDLKNQFIASDPMFVQDRLFALTMLRGDQQEWTLRLSAFDPETGDVVTHHDVLHLRTGWQQRHGCEVTALDDAVVASLCGVLLCCDTTGNVRWIRKQVLLPADEETEWITQWFDAPLLHDGRLFVTAPGVRSIDCVQPETGKLIWNAPLPDVRRLAGIADGRLFVLTDTGVLSLSAADGRRLWTHAAPDILTGQLCGGEGGFLFARATSTLAGPPIKKPRPELVWLDPQTGQPRATAPLDAFEDDDPRLGPFVHHNGRIWTFFGRGPNEPKRDFVELVKTVQP